MPPTCPLEASFWPKCLKPLSAVCSSEARELRQPTEGLHLRGEPAAPAAIPETQGLCGLSLSARCRAGRAQLEKVCSQLAPAVLEKFLLYSFQSKMMKLKYCEEVSIIYTSNAIILYVNFFHRGSEQSHLSNLRAGFKP